MAFCMQLALTRVLANRRGVTAIEYAVLALGVVSVIGVGVAAFGEAVQSLFAALRGAIIAAASS
jgi:Flp pilus assembly pilin Flp